VPRVLGIDPGSVKLGYGVIDVHGAQLRYVECGVLEAPGSMPVYERLSVLGRELEQLLTEFRPNEAALEAGFVKSQQGALVSGAARGVAGYLCARWGIPVREYAPKAVKKAVTAYGGADKDAVARMVQLRLGMQRLPPHDASDALAIAIAHAHRPTVLLKR
jgi:crossover junction endodeoxyribonuclease RuvC